MISTMLPTHRSASTLVGVYVSLYFEAAKAG
jgi:hypothetical protein